MCGLWGVVGNTIGKNEIACFRDLGLISSLRGLDSTGITVVSKAKKNKWNVEYYKDATDSTNFLFYNKKTHNLLENTRNVFAIMGHARAATIGNVTADNAHPFHVGNIVVCTMVRSSPLVTRTRQIVSISMRTLQSMAFRKLSMTSTVVLPMP